MKKMLVLGTYPIINAQHGGQKRTKAIVEAYSEQFEVRYCAVYYAGYYPEANSADIPVGVVTERKIQADPQRSELLCGDAIYEDKVVYRSVVKLLETFKPDVIHIEQPYSYIGLRKLLERMEGIQPKLVYGSQNIEYKMKKQIFSSLDDIAPADASEIVSSIKELEEDFSKTCDLLCAVSESDALAHKKMGAQSVVVAANGIKPTLASELSRRRWQDYFATNGIVHPIVFVASAHPPNWVGFLKMLGNRMGFLPVSARIYLVGGVAEYFTGNFQPNTVENITFWQRVESCGKLSDDELAGLLAECEVILLPITEGGGSNLKTAEAVHNDKKIVATPYAFRSFDEMLALPNIHIASSEKSFKKALLEAIETPYKERTTSQHKLSRSVEWSYGLKKLVRKALTL